MGDALRLDLLLDWRRIRKDGRDTKYDFDCTSDVQKKTGLCKFMNNRFDDVASDFCDNEYGMYGTFKPEEDTLDSVKEGIWSFVSIHISCKDGRAYYELDDGKRRLTRRRLLTTRSGQSAC